MLRVLFAAAYSRYLAVSAAALAVDFGSFMALLDLRIPAMLASGLAYGGGIVTHWALSSRAVFAAQLADSVAARHRQRALFAGSALVGLAITISVVGAATMGGMDPRLAKLAAIAVSFQAVWLLRRHIVFAR